MKFVIHNLAYPVNRRKGHTAVFLELDGHPPYVQIKKRATGRLKGSQGLHAANAQAEGEAEGPWKAR